MKKALIIAMLLSLLCACSLSAGVCFADETSGDNYYYVKSGEELTVYSSSQIDSAHSILQIPSTYAFKYVAEADNDFVEIDYNGCKGYIMSSKLNSSCEKVTAKWGNNPYEYKYTASNFNSFGEGVSEINTYSFVKGAWTQTSESAPIKYMTVTNVYGYYKDNNQEVYFLVNFTIKIMSAENTFNNYYIKATDFTTPQADITSIPDSEGYKAQTKPDPTISSGNNNSGNDSNSNSTSGKNTSTKDTTNSFERYILIAVIAVLCVVIIILIFVPTRRKQN